MTSSNRSQGNEPPKWPSRYQLSADEKQSEQAKLQFKREVSGRHYLTWDQLMQSVQPGKTYRTFGYGGVHEVHQAEELMEQAHREVTGRSCTYIETATEVPSDYRIPTEDLRNTYVDPANGKTMVEGHSEDVWDGSV